MKVGKTDLQAETINTEFKILSFEVQLLLFKMCNVSKAKEIKWATDILIPKKIS